MKIVSYFTDTGEYPAYAERLRNSCDRFGLNHAIVKAIPQADWKLTCNLKPHFLLKNLLETRGPILWCDADCEFLKLPSIFWKGRYDFAIYNFNADAANHDNFTLSPEQALVSSGVLYIDYTAPALELLIRWIDAVTEAKGTIVDDQVLDMVWRNHRPPVEVLWLPRQANWMVQQFGEPREDTIIRHDFITSKGFYRPQVKEAV